MKSGFSLLILYVSMYLADTFIQGVLQYIAFRVFILSVNAFSGNQTHDLGIAIILLYCLNYRIALHHNTSIDMTFMCVCVSACNKVATSNLEPNPCCFQLSVCKVSIGNPKDHRVTLCTPK